MHILSTHLLSLSKISSSSAIRESSITSWVILLNAVTWLLIVFSDEAESSVTSSCRHYSISATELWQKYKYSGAPIMQTPFGTRRVFWLQGCSHFTYSVYAHIQNRHVVHVNSIIIRWIHKGGSSLHEYSTHMLLLRTTIKGSCTHELSPTSDTLEHCGTLQFLCCFCYLSEVGVQNRERPFSDSWSMIGLSGEIHTVLHI